MKAVYPSSLKNRMSFPLFVPWFICGCVVVLYIYEFISNALHFVSLCTKSTILR